MVKGRVASDGSYVYIDPDRLAAYVRDNSGDIMRDLTRRATRVQAGARRQVGKRTRRLERSIVKRQGVDARGPFILVVTEGVPYGIWHHEGNTRGWPGNRFLTDNLHLAGQ
jgi:hypothetical protein